MTPIRNATAALLAAVLLLLPGCEQGAPVRGLVTDMQGHALPGVAVTVRNTTLQDPTDALGQYDLRLPPGTAELEFAKTGYTPARLTLAITDFRTLQADTVRLWNLPPEKGVFLLREHRYQPLTRTEPRQYRIADGPLVLATRKDPDLKTTDTAPFLVCHKLPPYDVRLHRMEQIEAALPESNAALETVWAATDSIPVAADALDEPDRLLLALRPDTALTPGRYAIHWGALDGYDSIDTRIFLIEIAPLDPEPDQAETVPPPPA